MFSCFVECLPTNPKVHQSVQSREDRVPMPRFLLPLLTQDPPQTLQAANPSGPHTTDSHI